MSRSDISFLTIRAFAVYAWFQALLLLGIGHMGGFGDVDSPAPDASAFRAALIRSLYFMPSVVFAVLGVILFIASRRLSRVVLLPSAAPEPASSAFVFAQAVFSAVGLSIVVHILPDLMRLPNIDWRYHNDLRGLVGTVGQVIVGSVMFFRPAWFTRGLLRIKPQ